MRYRELKIGKKEAGHRLDVLLSKRFGRFSRNKMAQFIEQGMVSVSGRTIKPSSIVQLGETVLIQVPELIPSEPPPRLPDVVYEDDRILVVNKPAGLLVHPVGDVFVWGLIGLFKSAYPHKTVDLVHRLPLNLQVWDHLRLINHLQPIQHLAFRRFTGQIWTKRRS